MATTGNSAEILSLEERIQTVTNLYNRFQSLRQIPTLLLRPPAPTDLPAAALSSIRPEFENVKEMRELVCSDAVQEALRAARESEKADGSALSSNFRRESRKRRRPPSPESPQPYVSFQPKTSSLFPIRADEPAPLRADDLPDYIRTFNRTSPHRLHIWSPARPDRTLCSPLIVRFSIRDVLTAFVTLSFSEQDGTLVTQTVTAFGPRERRSPHTQSEYIAYQNLSQHIALMVQSYPRVSFQSMMSLLRAYAGLFSDRCTHCHRVLSIEGHVPPVGRLWIDAATPAPAAPAGAGPGTDTEGEKGYWQPRHTICLHS